MPTFCLGTHRKRSSCNHPYVADNRDPEKGKTHLIHIPSCAVSSFGQMVFKVWGFFSSSDISHFTDEEIEAEKSRHQGSCHLCKLKLMFRGSQEPWAQSPACWSWPRHSGHTGKMATGHPRRHLHSPSIARAWELTFLPPAYSVFTGSWLAIKFTVKHVGTRCVQHCLQLCLRQLKQVPYGNCYPSDTWGTGPTTEETPNRY